MCLEQDNENVDIVFMNLNQKFGKATLDTGTTKTCSRKYFINHTIELIPKEERHKIIRRKDNRVFRFGDSKRYPSREEVTIPIKRGKLESKLYVSIVDADLPLLMSKDDMAKLKLTINCEKETVQTGWTGEVFELEKDEKNNLWQLPLFEVSLDPKKHDVLMMEDMTIEEKFKKIKKVHHLMCHPTEPVLKKFFKESNDDDDETQQLIEDISRSCIVCIRHKRTPPRPRAGLPVSSDFNDVVALDLKILQKNKKPILYAVDTYSRLTRGTVIKTRPEVSEADPQRNKKSKK